LSIEEEEERGYVTVRFVVVERGKRMLKRMRKRMREVYEE
jgi:hypothetical protein